MVIYEHEYSNLLFHPYVSRRETSEGEMTKVKILGAFFLDNGTKVPASTTQRKYAAWTNICYHG